MTEALHSSLAESISARLRRPVARLPNRQGQLTSAETHFVLTELVRLLAPTQMLEIGTFFADTAHVVATAMAQLGHGHLVTIDPFGAHRVPDVIARWPGHLRERVTFRADNSMSFFLHLDEELHAKRGNEAPFNLIYVDGHHAFEYAFFDLMRSCLYLRPGGVFVVDNIEAAGPATAVRLFLERQTHWQLFKTGGAEMDRQSLAVHPQTNSAMILAPEGIEIGPLPYVIDLFDTQVAEIRHLQLRVRRGAAGRLRAVTCVYSRPLDYAYTGEGEQSRTGVSECSIGNVLDEFILIPFEPPLSVSPRPDDTVAAQIELSFVRESRDNLLVDSDPIVIA